MKLHHIAFWTNAMEAMVEFYHRHFGGRVLFAHESGDFRCVFVRLDGDITLELMHRSGLPQREMEERTGYSHLSIEVADRAEVDRLTDYFRKEGVPLVKIREEYDDGFYESSVLDPEGNIIELAAIDRAVNPAV